MRHAPADDLERGERQQHQRAGSENSPRHLQRIEVRDVEQYQKDLASPAGQELLRQLYDRYLERPKNVFFWAEPIED